MHFGWSFAQRRAQARLATTVRPLCPRRRARGTDPARCIEVFLRRQPHRVTRTRQGTHPREHRPAQLRGAREPALPTPATRIASLRAPPADAATCVRAQASHNSLFTVRAPDHGSKAPHRRTSAVTGPRDADDRRLASRPATGRGPRPQLRSCDLAKTASSSACGCRASVERGGVTAPATLLSECLTIAARAGVVMDTKTERRQARAFAQRDSPGGGRSLMGRRRRAR
jgi:hypothetical protein